MSTYSVSITYPNDKATDILNTVTDYLGYQVNLVDAEGVSTPNPQTRKQFLDLKVKDYIKECYKAGKAQAADNSRVTAISDAEAVEMSI